MSLRLSTVHENSLLHLSHLFSASTSAIFMAARDLLLFVFNKKQQMLLPHAGSA